MTRPQTDQQERYVWMTRREILAGLSGISLTKCHWRDNVAPSIRFTRIPQADPAGRQKNDIVEGVVQGAKPGQSVVLYAKSGKWWIEPLFSQPFTKVQANSKWTNATHLGTDYAALLVEANYKPQPSIDTLPVTGGGVAAVSVVPGSATPPSPMLRFSGYDWRVRDAPSARGGNNRYDPANAWVDDRGAMHLRIAKAADDWTCAEVSLTRSLGYGTYQFVVQDTSQLESASIFGMFTWDYAGGDQGNREMDIEIARPSEPGGRNAQYVVQPYFVAENVSRFTVPSGRLMHSFRWEDGRVTFRTTRSLSNESQRPLVAEHVFTSGVPSPGIESVRMNLYIVRDRAKDLRNSVEVVIERFEYLP